MKSLKNKKIILVLILLGFAVFTVADRALAADIINVNFPCLEKNCEPPANIAEYLNSFYGFAVGVAGLLALGMIVAGGVYYTVSAGSGDKQKEAKSMITSAILGVILLFGSYLILRTVNPRITNLSIGFTDITGKETEKLTAASTLAGESVQINNDCGDFKFIPTNPRVSVNGVDQTCSDRVFYAPGQSPIVIRSDDRNYDETVSIAPGSKVWQYAYYDGKLGPGGGKDCLIYAFRSPNSSSTYMVSLQPTLRLCAPKPQNIAATNVADCSSPETCARKYNTKYPSGNSPDLAALIGCIATKVPEAPVATTRTYTVDESHPLCNYTRGNPTTDPNNTTCSHTVNSCHYGGRTGSNGAEAVDYGRSQFVRAGVNSAEILQKILNASIECGAKSARCESSSPARTVDCSAPQATHVHVNTKGCDAN